jgi:hypothetical protein
VTARQPARRAAKRSGVTRTTVKVGSAVQRRPQRARRGSGARLGTAGNGIESPVGASGRLGGHSGDHEPGNEALTPVRRQPWINRPEPGTRIVADCGCRGPVNHTWTDGEHRSVSLAVQEPCGGCGLAAGVIGHFPARQVREAAG